MAVEITLVGGAWACKHYPSKKAAEHDPLEVYAFQERVCRVSRGWERRGPKALTQTQECG